LSKPTNFDDETKNHEGNFFPFGERFQKKDVPQQMHMYINH